MSDIQALLRDLTSSDSRVRGTARRELQEVGEPAVVGLLELLRSPKGDVRWEAARTLRDMALPAAAPALVAALDDQRRDIRWLAAEGLIAIGPSSVRKVLSALIGNSGSLSVREGGRQVLRSFNKEPYAEALRPVLQALDGPVPDMQTPIAAFRALDQLP